VGALVALGQVRSLRRAAAADEARRAARFAALERRVQELETAGVAEALPRIAPAAPAGVVSGVRPGVPPPLPPPARPRPLGPAPPPLGAAEIERLIGGRVLNRVGIAALLLAAAFFLRYAFENDWIGPVGRVSLGLLSGAALLALSQWVLGRGYLYFSEGVTALGAGILYLSLYAGRQIYGFLPEGISFAAMIAVTAAVAALGLGRDSERLAFLAFLGGFLTPILLSTGRDAQVELFTYLAILNAAGLAFARLRGWRTLEPLSLGWTVIYFAGWYARFYAPDRLGSTLAFALLFFVEFALLNALRSRRDPRLRPEQVALALANVAWLLAYLHRMLYARHRWGLTFGVLALGAAHLAILGLVRRPAAGPVPAARYLYGGLALTFATLAIPIRLEGEWIAIAWAVEGTLLLLAGLRSGNLPLRASGLVLHFVAPLVLLAHLPEAARPIANPRLGSFAAVLAALGVAVLVGLRRRAALREEEARALQVLGVAWNALAVVALSLEVWDFASWVGTGLDERLARHLALSLLWTACGAILLLVGVRRGVAALRWQGLALLGITTLKVFLHDLSFLSRAYRILSFLALGAVLLVVSFLYQRRLAAGPERGPR
jgi:uncharacterized membrane protein